MSPNRRSENEPGVHAATSAVCALHVQLTLPFLLCDRLRTGTFCSRSLCWLFRLFIMMSATAPVASPCTCFPLGVKQDTSSSAVVFRGVVTSVKDLPARPESSRSRHEVTFTVSEYWKGTTTKQITLHIVDPGTY